MHFSSGEKAGASPGFSITADVALVGQNDLINDVNDTIFGFNICLNHLRLIDCHRAIALFYSNSGALHGNDLISSHDIACENLSRHYMVGQYCDQLVEVLRLKETFYRACWQF